jgi:DNA-binding response OmpR family regulator
MTPAPTVLVVDDNVKLAGAVARVLTGAGYTVQTAFTAEDGFRLAKAREPAAIVLDLSMPFVNGVGLLFRLRALPALARTPVLIVTGMTLTEETRADLAELGAVIRFKPLEMSELLAEIRNLLDLATR